MHFIKKYDFFIVGQLLTGFRAQWVWMQFYSAQRKLKGGLGAQRHVDDLSGFKMS